MINILIYVIIIFIIPIILLSINFLFFKKKMINREKNSPFECGFDPLENTRIPVSIQFFLISLIFLIFDIEITLLIPLIFNFIQFNNFMIKTFFILLIILMIGIYIEYMEQSIDWKN